MALSDDSIPRPTLAKMVECIDPTWTHRDASRAPGGYLPVHVLDVATPDGPRRAVLKESPDEERHGIDLEARMLRILQAHTPIPVPVVHGAVDADDDLPSPFVCMDFVPGRTVERSELDSVSAATPASFSRASGRYLAELHALDAVDAYGYLERDPDTTLRGCPAAGVPRSDRGPGPRTVVADPPPAVGRGHPVDGRRDRLRRPRARAPAGTRRADRRPRGSLPTRGGTHRQLPGKRPLRPRNSRDPGDARPGGHARVRRPTTSSSWSRVCGVASGGSSPERPIPSTWSGRRSSTATGRPGRRPSSSDSPRTGTVTNSSPCAGRHTSWTNGQP